MTARKNASSSAAGTLRIAAAQLDSVVGDFRGNVEKIRAAYERAVAAGVRVLLTPELSVCGYPPHDLVDRPEIFDRCEESLKALMSVTLGQSTALVVGHVARNDAEFGRTARNCVSVLEGGKEVFRQAKTLLPTYDVFDEARYFEPATETKLWELDGVPVGIAICEDLWGDDPTVGRKLYRADPVARLEALRPRLLISISASPYEWGKRSRREALHGEVARRLQAPLLYVNQTGATDEILFDGASFAVDARGEFAGRLPAFLTSDAVWEVDIDGGSVRWATPDAAGREDQAPAEIEVLHRGLVTGIREYFRRTGFQKAVLGLSGGIDSAVVAVLGVEALGAENVLGVAMPSQYSSPHSLADAEASATALGIRFEVRPIKFLFSAAQRELGEGRGGLAPVAQENLQSRLRALTLLALSNHEGSLVLTTGNKSELAMGYCTLYGDMAGALAPIGDLLKTRVYELARHLNRLRPGIVPESSITKAPSAELRPNQTDQDTLPPYEALDALLEGYLEHNIPVSDLEKQFGGRVKDPLWIRQVLRRLELNEFKRRQAAPVLKVSHKAFGIGRRIPLAKVWDA